MLFLYIVYTLFTITDSATRTIPNNFRFDTRRILAGHEVGDTRPYMVYLRPSGTETELTESNWLCGGVIIHEQYILTSAACIEEAKHFYVVSGTHRWIAVEDGLYSDCIKNGAKKAVWKCVPKSYVYDGQDFDNILWMANDIAVVKVEDEFNFEKRVRGCDFVPKIISYNNISEDLEKPGTKGAIAGWGSIESYSPNQRSMNSPELLEAEVEIMSKPSCKKRWEERYHYIIDNYMICAKDALDTEAMSSLCLENDVKCKHLGSEEKTDLRMRRQLVLDPDYLFVHGKHNNTRRSSVGGFCENDHGGPLIIGHANTAVVVGIISACLTKELSKKCYGPFLYTSVWKNRNLINCAIYKDQSPTCRRLLKQSNTELREFTFTWRSHPDGPAKSEL